jgi:hypothetical protein
MQRGFYRQMTASWLFQTRAGVKAADRGRLIERKAS